MVMRNAGQEKILRNLPEFRTSGGQEGKSKRGVTVTRQEPTSKKQLREDSERPPKERRPEGHKVGVAQGPEGRKKEKRKKNLRKKFTRSPHI